MLEIMFVIGFLSYLIQNAATGIISAANRELPPKAKLRMAEIDAARAAGVVAPARYGLRDYFGDWISDALQHARDDRREREEARRRGDDAAPAPAGGESSEAPTLETQPEADPGQQPAPAEPAEPAGAQPGPVDPDVIDMKTSLACNRCARGVIGDDGNCNRCGQPFDRGTPAPDAGVGEAPTLATEPAADPAPQPATAAPAEPVTQPAASSSPTGQRPAAAARGGHYGWSCEKCGTFREGFATEAESRADGSGHVCPNTQPSAPAGEQPAAGQRPDLRLVPPPADDEQAALTPDTTSPAWSGVLVGGTGSGKNPAPTDNTDRGQGDRPAPNTDPGTSPEQGGTTVSTTASAETTNIEAARVFLEELGEHVNDDLLAKVQTAAATLAGKNIDSETLAILARIQEQGGVLASLCTEGVDHLTTYHGNMEQAVNSTPEAADTEFYQHS